MIFQITSAPPPKKWRCNGGKGKQSFVNVKKMLKRFFQKCAAGMFVSFLDKMETEKNKW